MTSETPKSVSPFNGVLGIEDFELIFLENPQLAESAAKLCHRLLMLIESDADGIRNAREMLWEAIRLLFPYTETCRVCRDLFEKSLAESSIPENAPLAILTAAIQRQSQIII